MSSEKNTHQIVDIIMVNEEGAFLPQYSTQGAAGADLCAFLGNEDEKITILPGQRALVPTGIRIELPHGYEAQIRPRSGLAAKYGITVLNSPGTIDEDYRGEIKVILINLGEDSFTIKNGDRIAQMVISTYCRSNFIKKDKFSSTERGEGGFGSTGI